RADVTRHVSPRLTAYAALAAAGLLAGLALGRVELVALATPFALAAVAAPAAAAARPARARSGACPRRRHRGGVDRAERRVNPPRRVAAPGRGPRGRERESARDRSVRQAHARASAALRALGSVPAR